MSFAPHVPPSCGRCNQRIMHYPSQQGARTPWRQELATE